MCSPNQGTRRSGPSATCPNFTGQARDQHRLLAAVGPGVLDQHVTLGQVRVDHYLGVGGTRPGHQPRRVECGARLQLGLPRRPPFDGRADVTLEMVEPPRGGGEAGVLGPLRPVDAAGQVGPLVGAQHLQHEPAVVGPEPVQDAGPRCAHRAAERPEVGDDVEHRHHGIEHGHVDLLALAGAVALAQAGLDPDHGEEGGDDVAQPAHGRPDGGLAGRALELVGPAHGLHHGGQRGPPVVGGVRGARRHGPAEAGDGQVHHRRVDGGDVGVGQAQPLRRPGPEVLGHDVEARGQREHQVAAAGVLQVDDDGALVEVVAQEGGADRPSVGVGHGRQGGTPEVAGPGRLDLHDLGPQPAEQLGGPGQGLHLLEREDAHAVEGLAPGRRVRVDDVAQLHARSRSSGSPSISMALPRMILYTSSSLRLRTICSATARVSGQVESVCG